MSDTSVLAIIFLTVVDPNIIFDLEVQISIRRKRRKYLSNKGQFISKGLQIIKHEFNP